jgi:DNA (cytosine-5)-methyltransferase 1
MAPISTVSGSSPMTVLSLFSGCGGLDLGFVQAGFELKLSIDNWEPAVATHKLNATLLGGDVVRKSLCLSDGELRVDELPKCDVILGGPPCQGFSFAGKQVVNDPRNQLYLDFLSIVERLQPKCFVMENVRGIEAMALPEIVRSFSSVGYNVTADRVQATHFAVPQKRERVLIVGFRNDLCIRFSPPNETLGGLFGSSRDISIFEAIGDLPEPKSITSDETVDTHPSDPLCNHVFKPLSDQVQLFVRHIPNGGCFRDAPRQFLPKRLRTILKNPARYRSPRLFPKPDPFSPAQTVPADMNPSLGGVLAPDFVYVNNKYYTSPVPSRRFTPREAARLQTFPDKFIIQGSVSTQIRLIGNAVPVKLANAYAKQIREFLINATGQKRPKVA